MARRAFRRKQFQPRPHLAAATPPATLTTPFLPDVSQGRATRPICAGVLDCVGISATLATPFTPDVVQGRATQNSGRATRPIENWLHWQLDVTFGEDQCRIRKGHADANFSILRRTALSLLKNEKTAKVGMKNKRLTAGWDDAYLEKVLMGT